MQELRAVDRVVESALEWHAGTSTWETMSANSPGLIKSKLVLYERVWQGMLWRAVEITEPHTGR